MKRANTISTITVELIITMKTKFPSSNAEKTNEKTNGFISRMSEIFTSSPREPRFVLVPRASLGKPWSASNANKPASSKPLKQGPKKWSKHGCEKGTLTVLEAVPSRWRTKLVFGLTVYKGTFATRACALESYHTCLNLETNQS